MSEYNEITYLAIYIFSCAYASYLPVYIRNDDYAISHLIDAIYQIIPGENKNKVLTGGRSNLRKTKERSYIRENFH